MKTIDLIKKIQECKTPEQLLELQKLCPGYNVGFNFSEKRAFVKKDIRLAIKKRLAEEGLSARQFCKLIDYDNNNFNSFLRGERGLPFEVLEEVEGVLGL